MATAAQKCFSSGRAQRAPKVHITQFEREVQRLQISEDEWAASVPLRKWASRNRNSYYVPEWLLRTRGMVVHLND